MTWILHYHYPVQGKHGMMDLYSIEKSVNGKGQTIILAVPQGSSELVKLVEKSMNGVDEKNYADPHPVLQRMFYGPWAHDNLTGINFVKISDEEKRQIYHIIFHETAERLMAEANLKRLQQEFAALQKEYEIQGRQLLRAQANARLSRADYVTMEEKATTITDLLNQQPSIDQLDLPMGFCQKLGCGD